MYRCWISLPILSLPWLRVRRKNKKRETKSFPRLENCSPTETEELRKQKMFARFGFSAAGYAAVSPIRTPELSFILTSRPSPRETSGFGGRWRGGAGGHVRKTLNWGGDQRRRTTATSRYSPKRAFPLKSAWLGGFERRPLSQ